MIKSRVQVVVTEEEAYSPGAVENALRLWTRFLYQRVLAEMDRGKPKGSADPRTDPESAEPAERVECSIGAAAEASGVARD